MGVTYQSLGGTVNGGTSVIGTVRQGQMQSDGSRSILRVDGAVAVSFYVLEIKSRQYSQALN